MSVDDVTPATRKPKLAELVVGGLRKSIMAGQYVAGQKLPTESQLTKQFGVSRTVVREALAALAADGLVQSRQGAGAFVIANATSTFNAIGGDRGNKISEALNVLEVRMGIEIESAGLAALRRSASQDAAIQEAYYEFERLLENGTPTGKTDFAFHRAIAAATNNPFYIEVLDALGSRTIPCDVASPWGTESVLTYEYQAGLQREHFRILGAISAQNAEAAREAMRQHLSLSQERYRARLCGDRYRHELGFSDQ
ncbi:GntR family transcriptional regulator [Devosia limi DSM 17137]|uniref:DNA-binding transcriptional regulator, FadR family n=1 Tax=Devosia limi DSM 17137 TaxID=1121477 RepID=A0A0F5LPF0_9HYPH|nr:FadR/GntR family transcriptional regulator [Devosia limi]KKB84211.1 GntR family transcriptional regulator [Devosia limi DSM 17137]KKB84304.1 GntR family transcriptional regulator [Devosia limi DSM 17137]SHE83761.1 DNA-binding transcriptional regulator, FadR family [Devosia limi DSM 17137]